MNREPSTRSPVRIRFPVRWEDTDMTGVVFYGNLFRFFDLAEEELFRARGRTRFQILTDFNLWLPRVEVHAEYLVSARFGQTIEVVVRVGKIGRSTVRYDFEVEGVWTVPQVMVARGHVVTACVSRQTLRAVRMPRAMRELLNR